MQQLTVTAAIIEREDELLIAQRKADAHQGSLWEFPGGKVRFGEEPSACLVREIQEELGVTIEVGSLFSVENQVYGDRQIILLVYRCRLTTGEPRPLDCQAIAWVRPHQLAGYDLAAADRRVATKLTGEKVGSMLAAKPPQVVLDLQANKEYGRHGFVYQLKRVVQNDAYLYYERDFVDHPRTTSIESVVFPGLNFKATRFHNISGAPHPFEWYVDMVDAQWESPQRLRVVDLYLDVIQRRERSGCTVVDIGEFREALAAGSITPMQVQLALAGLETVCRAFDANRGQFTPYLRRLMAGAGFDWGSIPGRPVLRNQ